MKALISPLEKNRICQVQELDFEVAKPLFWTDCPINCTTEWTYSNGDFFPPEPYIPTEFENKQTAMTILKETDWTAADDVGNSEKANPYLANQNEFIAYRNAVRQYAINPIAGNIDWPAIPQENWQSV